MEERDVGDMLPASHSGFVSAAAISADIAIILKFESCTLSGEELLSAADGDWCVFDAASGLVDVEIDSFCLTSVSTLRRSNILLFT